MLVLSRKIGDCIVIGDGFVVTVAFLAEDHAELSLTRLDGSFVRSATVRCNEWFQVDDQIRVVVVQIEKEKARIGIDAPSDNRVHRGEFWNLPR
ncbi:MAG: carbon storage regulator [Deltaproteobacteria bacterium]